MAHDSQTPREPAEEVSIVSSKQLGTSQDVVLNWLRLYAAMPYMREKADKEKWNWDEIILFYSSSLAKLPQAMALHRSFEWHRDHTKWLPQPCELREQYEIEVGKLIAMESQSRERLELCGDCRGTGWKIVPRTDGLAGNWALACDCRKKKTA